MSKYVKYKEILQDIQENNLVYTDIIHKNIPYKYIYLELLLSEDMDEYLVKHTPCTMKELEEYFYLIYKYTKKYQKQNKGILEKCKEYFKYKPLRSHIIKILKLYVIDDIDFIVKYNLYDLLCIKKSNGIQIISNKNNTIEKSSLDEYNHQATHNKLITSDINRLITEKINTKDYKFVKKFIFNLPTKYTKIGYLNLRDLCKQRILEYVKGDINELFMYNKYKKELYQHEDEEVRIENFINDPNRNADEFIRKNTYFKELYNIDYLMSRMKCEVSTETICTLVKSEIDNIRYLGYSLLNNMINKLMENDIITLSNELQEAINYILFDKNRIIRDKFTDLYKFVNLDFYKLLTKKINHETLLKYIKIKKINLDATKIHELLLISANENKRSDVSSHNTNIIHNIIVLNANYNLFEIQDYSKYKLTRKILFYTLYKSKNYMKLVNYLFKEENLGNILVLKKYLSEIFSNLDTFNYKKFTNKIFQKLDTRSGMYIRKSGGISTLFKVILCNKKHREDNLRYLRDILLHRLEIGWELYHTYNILIEIFAKYEILDPNFVLDMVMRNIQSGNFMIKNFNLRLFEILYKKYDMLKEVNINECKTDDSIYISLILHEKFRNVNLEGYRYEGQNLYIKMKLKEMQIC